MTAFDVEYRTPTGRFATIRVEAASEDAAREATVQETGCDFGDIQNTERRASADAPADFDLHVALILAEQPNTTEAKAKFIAWQEGPTGLARRTNAAEATRDRYQIFDSLDRACGPEASSDSALFATLETLQGEAEEEGDRITYAIAKWTGDGWTFDH